ncbi:MAG: MBL fold metallo-hydrolase [Oscillospiraceae bacterium]|nr:MBL fold metallo-hydrolase [Oscillospiraceae bacterium]
MVVFDIISTGSKGNAVVVNSHILIDCGVSFRAVKNHPDFRAINLVLLTHIHGDHFNRTTIRKLAQERPTLRFGCPPWLVADIAGCGADKRNVDVYGMGTGYRYGGFVVEPFPLPHNVQNCGYKIFFDGCGKMIYATDTNNMTGIEAKDYDLYLIEANYTEEDIVERIRKKQETGEFCHEYAVLENHLSREKALNFIYKNIGPNGQYVFLHQHEGGE